MSSYNTLIRALASLLLGTYGTMLLNRHLGVSILLSPVAGIVIALVVFWFLGYTKNKARNYFFDKKLMLLSLGIAGILIVTDPGHFNPVIKPEKSTRIKVTALAEKNDSAKQNEVRITNIHNGGEEVKLHNIPLTGGWRKKDNTLVSSSGQPNILELAIDDPDSLKLAFSRNPMSGKVKIEEDTITTIEDLYSITKSTYLYTSHSQINSAQNIYEKAALSAVNFLALGIFCYVSLLWVRLKNNYHLLVIPLSILLFYVSDYFEGSFLKRLILCALSVGAFSLMNGAKARAFTGNYTRKDKAILLLLTCYATFAFIGYRSFLVEFPINNVLSKLVHFILFGGWLTSMLLAFLILTEFCKQAVIKRNTYNLAQQHSHVKLYFTFAGIILLCWLVYLTGFFPAIMSADSLVQWEQITGLSKINNWHPVIHTMFNKFFQSIYNSPVSVALAQMFLMAGIAANFFLFLYKRGIPAKWLMWSALAFALIPANGIYSVTIWKDIPFTFSLLWLTLVLAKIVTDDSYINKIPSYIEIVLALVCAALFRHNGIPVFILAIVGLLIYFFKTKKVGLAICVAISVGFVAWYNSYISDPSRVIPTPPSVKLVAPIHGMAAVRYYGGQLSAESTQEMEKVLPDSIWVNFYNPFSADEYIYFCNRPFIENLASLPTGEAVRLYANTFVQNPYLVIRDRLCGAELLWNVYDAPGAYNYKYHTQIDENKFGLTMSNNFVKKILLWYLEKSEKLGDPIFWRAGIYNILLLLLLFAFVKQRKWNLLIFIPFLGSVFALLLSMTIQNFRYVYFAPLIFGFVWLLYISNFKLTANFNKSLKAK